ncbi:MAG: hypothetical protein OEU92_31135 [Alphaproteobacteria bacterium]|nr:hypothetical protein [Alphaproteobacteria bacterium]
MDYLRDHWRGRHALWRAFWINFFIPFVLIAMFEPWIRPAAAGGSVTRDILAALYILITHGVILPWQIVGLWRSSRRHLEERGEIGVVTFAQGAVLVALVTTAGATITTVQHIFGFGLGPAERADMPPRYALRVLVEEGAIAIDGPFDTGLARDLKAILAATSDIEAIILNSDGGRVFEARGVAKQIKDNGLDTHVDAHCRSACTIAYIAGSTRTLGARAQLGFHSYSLDGLAPLTDPTREQEKDQAFYLRQGVQPDFVVDAFTAPHGDMWHPDPDHLKRSGVVHRIIGAD